MAGMVCIRTPEDAGPGVLMAAESRAQHSMINSTVSVCSKITAIVFGYLTRVVFIRVLSEDYVGLNGLLSNILGVLNMTSMGIGTAMVYAMYAPAARGDVGKQCALMRLYGRIYRIFSLVVLGFGALIYPFLPLLIRKPWEHGGLPLIYGLYVASAVVSYFQGHKSMMFLVNQRDYVNELFTAGFLVLQDVVQCAVLLLTRDYYLFLLIYLSCTLLRNIAVSWYADRKYPFLRTAEPAPLSREEHKSISKNVRAILLHRMGSVVINNTDNLLLTYFFGLAAVGAYSNYYLVVGSVRQILDRIVSGITASVGNLGVTEGKAQVERVYRASFFAASWIYGFAAICIALLIGPLIELSFGENYLLPWRLTLVLCLNLYLNGVRYVTLIFRDSLGLFWYDRHKTIAEALVNLSVSILLARFIGMTGVFLGTTVSILILPFWVELLVLYKRYFQLPMAPYLSRFLQYIVSLLLAFGATAAVCARIGGTPLERLLLCLPVCLIVPNAVLLLLLRGNWEFRLLWETFVPLVRDRLKRR